MAARPQWKQGVRYILETNVLVSAMHVDFDGIVAKRRRPSHRVKREVLKRTLRTNRQ
jgi:hypothetical protein